MFFNKNKFEMQEYISDYLYCINVTVGNKYFQNTMKCFIDKENKTIKIGDILIGEETNSSFSSRSYKNYIRKGYGAQMMNKLIDFAKNNNYKRIIGDLSCVDDNDPLDEDHRERQIRFYKRFGFKILPDEQSPSGIELILQ